MSDIVITHKPLDFAICQPKIHITAFGCANPTREGITHSEILLLKSRIENWRRHFRVTQRIIAVAWYTPPDLGEVMHDDRFVRLPTDMRDAVILELAWRNLARDSAIKWYLKWEYIVKIPDAPLWRKMKQYGVRIKNYQDHQLFDGKALDYFYQNLNKSK